MTKALVILSGGQDSTVCLFWAKNQGFDEIHAVTFDYGQRHKIELESAKTVAEMAGVKSHEIVELNRVLKGTSPLISDNNLEYYDSYNDLPGGIEKTFVPLRNQLFITIAANRAYVLNCRNLIMGVCQEDYGGYPDCRQSFITYMEYATNKGAFTGEKGTPGELKIHTPLMTLTKAESVILASKLPGCYEALAYSHTAYGGEYPPTSNDHASVLRKNGFEKAGVPDPLILRAVYEGLIKLPRDVNYTCAKGVKAKSFSQFLKKVRENAANNIR